MYSSLHVLNREDWCGAAKKCTHLHMPGVNRYVGPVLTNCPWVFDNRCGVVGLTERGIQRYNMSFPSIKKPLMIAICEKYT